MKPRWFSVVLAAVLLACGSLSSLPSSSAGGSGGGGNSGNPASKVLFQDDFSDSSGWGTGSDANKSVQYANSALEFQVFKANDFIYSTPSDTDYQDVHIEVTVQPVSSKSDTSFGILCDQQVTGDAFYYLAVTPSGQYVIARAAVAKDDVILTNDHQWAGSKLIPVNASSYTLGADCAGGSLTLYVNGQKIDSVTDSAYAQETVGVFAWSDEKSNSVDTSFDDFTVSSIQ